MPEVVSQFYEHLDRIMAAMVTWNCGLFIAAQTWHLTQEIHPYGFHLVRGAIAPTLHTGIASAYLNTYECYRNGDEGRGWEDPSGILHVTRLLFGYLYLIAGLEVPIFVQCRIKFLSALESRFGGKFKELIEGEEIDLSKWIMRFVPLESIYGLCLRVPTVWPGAMRNDYVELVQYLEADRDDVTQKWFSNVRAAVNAPRAAGCRAERDMTALRMSMVEDGVSELERCYSGRGIFPGVDSRSFIVKVGSIVSSRGQDLDFKSIDFLRTRLMYNGAIVQHRYKRPDDMHTATRLVSTDLPSRRYIVAPSRTVMAAIPGALSGEGYVIPVGGALNARPEGSRKDVAANLVFLSKEAGARMQALEQAAGAMMTDAYAKSLVPSRVPEKMREVHMTAADTQQRISEAVTESERLQR
uniref:PEP-utilizers domain-containing protein n=1 Tax=Haemonchus contortus TaxID=6289 RepID=A0A7I4YVU5_HAECO